MPLCRSLRLSVSGGVTTRESGADERFGNDAAGQPALLELQPRLAAPAARPNWPVACRRTHDRPSRSAFHQRRWLRRGSPSNGVEHRHATLAMRLQQDLRQRRRACRCDLRRGYWAAPAASRPNPHAAFAPQAAASDAASYAYSRDAIENHCSTVHRAVRFAPALRRDRAAARRGGWQALTDAGTLVVTEFLLELRLQQVSLLSTAHAPCPAGVACDAHVNVCRLALRITARAASDASLVRRIDTGAPAQRRGRGARPA